MGGSSYVVIMILGVLALAFRPGGTYAALLSPLKILIKISGQLGSTTRYASLCINHQYANMNGILYI